jgi:hypothetical protein
MKVASRKQPQCVGRPVNYPYRRRDYTTASSSLLTVARIGRGRTCGRWRSTMNSSPPPPSFTLPPLNARGQFPITPSPTPSPDKEHDNLFSPRKNKEAHDVEDVGRISMYVKLFDGKPPLATIRPDELEADGQKCYGPCLLLNHICSHLERSGSLIIS